jgi:hypothetical protein
MLAIYLKYHKAGLTPTTPVTSIAISPVKMSIVKKMFVKISGQSRFELSFILLMRLSLRKELIASLHYYQ